MESAVLLKKVEAKGQAMPLARCPDVPELLSSLPIAGRTVMDVGCNGWIWEDVCRAQGAALAGADMARPDKIPKGAKFFLMRGERIESQEDVSDLTIASHVIEHLQFPMVFMHELARITKPGGFVWIECPSEISLGTTEFQDPTNNSFESFWSDPTHVRPYPPGAIYRLGIGSFLLPVAISREVRDFGASFAVTRALFKKPSGFKFPEQPRYVTFRGVQSGLDNAWKHIWPECAEAIKQT